MQGGPASLQALASRQVDISTNAFFGTTAQVVASGAPIKAVIASYGTNQKTGSAVVALPDSGLTDDPHSFIGTKVAVNTLGANAEAVLDTWFVKGKGGTWKSPVKWESVAVDPKEIPLGSRLEIEAYPGKKFVAWDTGGAIRGKHIDVFLGPTTMAEGKALGRKTSRVRIRK